MPTRGAAPAAHALTRRYASPARRMRRMDIGIKFKKIEKLKTLLKHLKNLKTLLKN